MAGAAGNRIRRANFLDLVADTLDSCRTRIDEAMPAVRAIAIRHRPAARRAGQAACRRNADRTAGQPAAVGEPPAGPRSPRAGASARSRWCCESIRASAACLAGALLYRARTPAQVALWGAFEGMRTWRRRRQDHRARQGVDRAAAGGWDAAELRKAALIVEGYAAEAGLGADIPVCPGRQECLPHHRRYTCRRGPDGRRGVCRPRLGRPGIAGLPARPASHPLVHPLALRNPAGRDAGTAAVPVGEEFLL